MMSPKMVVEWCLKKKPQLLKCYLSMSLGVLRRPTLVTIVVVSSYGGLKGLLWFLVACPSSNWLSGAALGNIGSTLFSRYFFVQ